MPWWSVCYIVVCLLTHYCFVASFSDGQLCVIVNGLIMSRPVDYNHAFVSSRKV